MVKKLSKKKQKWIERRADCDRSYKSIIYNRAFVCIFFVLLQLATFIALLLLTKYGWLWQLFVGVVSVLLVIFLEGREQRNPTKTLWIILLLVVPLVGLPLYFLYGGGKTTAPMRRKYRQAAEKLPPISPPRQKDGEVGRIGRALNGMGFPSYFDGRVEYYPTGKAFFEEMKKSISSAEKYVLMEYFILSVGKMWNELLRLLLERAEAGVEVKIIYDDMGSMFCLPPHYGAYLEGLHQNVKCLAFNKVYPIFTSRYNHRDHRKILVVDGKEAFTGGINIADEYIDQKKRFGYWKDAGIKITGEAVASLTRTFMETWVAFKQPKLDVTAYFQPACKADGGGLIAPYADSPLDGVRVSESVYLEMINRAEKRLYIATPYLVLDELLRSALCAAAARGVDVRIVTPGIPDKKAVYRLTRANYDGLLRAGVRIFEYSPGFLHAKNTLSDDGAAVGTANYDYRSLYLHFENMVYFEDEAAVNALAQDFEEIFLVSKQCFPSVKKKGFFARTTDMILRLFEPLL